MPSRRRTLAWGMALSCLSSTVLGGEPLVELWKLQSCGCCELWARHLELEGFRTQSHAVSDLGAIRTQLGVPPQLAGCHTARLADLVIEGHVPALAIRRLLAERPNWVHGLAVPGMPLGSPGMPASEPERYTVFLFGEGGRVARFLEFRGERLLRG